MEWEREHLFISLSHKSSIMSSLIAALTQLELQDRNLRISDNEWCLQSSNNVSFSIRRSAQPNLCIYLFYFYLKYYRVFYLFLFFQFGYLGRQWTYLKNDGKTMIIGKCFPQNCRLSNVFHLIKKKSIFSMLTPQDRFLTFEVV